MTPEGIKRILSTFYSIDTDIDTNFNAIERAKNFEKISNIVEIHLLDKEKNSQNLINNKSNTLRIVRLEN